MTHLMIKDLDAKSDLDIHAMQAIRGGADLSAFNVQLLTADAKAGLVAIAEATQVLVDTNTLLNLNVNPVTNINVGGIN